jgi:hypothetical protein
MSYAEVMDVDFSEYCRDQLEREVEGLDCNNFPPVELDKVDEDGKNWKIRFHFGFSRTQYHKTDMDIKSDVVSLVVKDVEMHERTSAHYYYPNRWDGIENAVKWIDEPTNTFMLSFEKGKDNFYLTIFHPKYLKSVIYKQDDNGNVKFKEGMEDNRLNQPRPEGYNMLYIQNTHANMVWQIGYGRQITIFDSRKAGKLSYIPKADIGINTGGVRSVHIQRNENSNGYDMQDVTEGSGITGINASIGHRLEYQKGKVSLFVDHKTIYSKISHGYLDGTAEYDLRMSPVTFGVGIDLFSNNKKNKKNKKKK